jgi:hypothetical protein
MCTTKDMLRAHLESKGAFKPLTHEVVSATVDILPEDAPYNLRLSIALSELITLISHLRRSITLHDGTVVPCNAITFALARSGQAKDSSMNMIRKAFKQSYNIIEDYREQFAVQKAEEAAKADGANTDQWISYYTKPRALQAGLGTVEGLVQHFVHLEEGAIGAASVNTSEIGTDLQSNPLLIDIIKTIAVGYDLGKIPSKIVKSSENQTGEVNALPINALLFGSEDAILYDNNIKAKFRTVFSTQLARRSLFSFSPDKVPMKNFKSITEVRKHKQAERERVSHAQELVGDYVHQLVTNIDTIPETLPLESCAQDLFDIYLEYNSRESEDLDAHYPISKLARKHKQWLALKLSGTYAILDQSETINESHYVDAINTIETLSPDLLSFEEQLSKEAYELFVQYMQLHAIDNKFMITLHDLRKLGYIPPKGDSTTNMCELVHLASSYDPEGVYTICKENSAICYEKQVVATEMGVSYIEVDNSNVAKLVSENADYERIKKAKAFVAATAVHGYDYGPTSFEELADLLTNDFAYTPFELKDVLNGADIDRKKHPNPSGRVRGRNNIVGGCSWVVLDVDTSDITDEEAHYLLEDINHHIARTSDPDNPFKFRVLLQLDTVVSVSDIQWKYFIQAIANKLQLEVDNLPKGQIYFSYADRNVLSVLDAEPLAAKEFILASSDALSGTNSQPKKLNKSQMDAQLQNKLTTFSYAFECEANCSRALIRAAKHAKDLGATKESVVALMHEINDYWYDPMDDERFRISIIEQVARWEF